MVNQINDNEQGHILTIEDPIEFVHESKKCLINQREVGTPHAVVRQRLAQRAARGSGHHLGRRDARSGNDPRNSYAAAEHEMSPFRRRSAPGDRFQIAHLADQDDVRILAAARCARRWRTTALWGPTSRWLIRHFFDSCTNSIGPRCEDVALLVVVDLVTMAASVVTCRTRRTGHEDDAAG